MGTMFVYITLIGAACNIMDSEEWPFGIAMWFSLITFTTIGLGDYAPAFDGNRTQVQKFFGYFFFGIGTMIGLALLSSVLAGIESLVHEYHVAMQKKIAAAASKARGVVEKAEKSVGDKVATPKLGV